MEIARETDLPDLLEHLGYQVRQVGRYHTTKEMDSLRIKNRRTWRRYSENTGGDAITFLQRFCGKSFPEAVEYLLDYHGPGIPPPSRAQRLWQSLSKSPLSFPQQTRSTAMCLPISEKEGWRRR